MHRIALCLVVLASATFAAAASAGVPNGNGHPLSAVGVSCEDGRTYDVLLVAGNGATGWRLGAEQPHHVIGVFSVTTFVDGVPVASETKVYGQKAGRPALACFGRVAVDDGVEVLVEATIHPVGKKQA